MITGKQIAAARTLLGWSQKDLDHHSGISIDTIRNIEGRGATPRQSTLNPIVETFHSFGVEFIDGGVRLIQDVVRVIDGDDCYLKLLDDVYSTLRSTKGEVLILCADDRVSSDAVNESYRRMRQAGVQMRQIIEDQNTYIMGNLSEYRYLPAQYFINNVTLIYADKVATVVQGESRITIIRDLQFSSTLRNLFEFLWDKTYQPSLSEAAERFE